MSDSNHSLKRWRQPAFSDDLIANLWSMIMFANESNNDGSRHVSNKSTLALVNEIKQEEQDFEWYPSTDEIIATVKNDMSREDGYFRWDSPSVLDCGAGDGRVLNALTNADKYAIEKSTPLLHALEKEIFVVGTCFHSQVLIDKKVDAVFSNPPYSEYVAWSTKIIREANAKLVYLVIPERWKDNSLINEAIEARHAEATVIGEFDFLNAERAARARVNIVRVDLSTGHRHCKITPFELWFKDNFRLDINKEESSKYEIFNSIKDRVKDAVKNELVSGRDTVQVLEKLYQRDLANLMETYKKLEGIDPVLMRELDVNLDSVRGALKLKIENLKDIYWQEFFDSFETITKRLTASNRRNMLDHLTAHTHIDFTVSNAYALAIWVIKNANTYFDDQLISTFERMVDSANIVNYVSNQRTFGKEEWRYGRQPSDLVRFGLEYRVVLDRIGGINTSDWEWERNKHGGLSERACLFLNDLRVIADNLGYTVSGYPLAGDYSWESNCKKQFFCRDRKTNEEKVLMEVRAFKNQNLHVFFDQDFMCRLNVEFGRLKGWLKSHVEAAEELNVNIDIAKDVFGTNKQLGSDTTLMLGFDQRAA